MSEGYRIHQVLSYHIIIYSPYNPAVDSNLSGISIHYFTKSYSQMSGFFFFLIFLHKLVILSRKLLYLFDRRDDKFFEHWSSSESIVSHLEV